MSDAALAIERQLKAVGTPARAAGEAKYLKSDLRFFGATKGDIRRVAKAAAPKGSLTHDDLVALVEELWAKPVFELRSAAALLLDAHVGLLDPGDLDMIERAIRSSKTWALVDVLAGDVAGKMNLSHPIKGRLDRWARDADFWVRRSALLAELRPLKGDAPFAPFAARADRMLEEKEFFIRKAIGWVLREMSKKRADEVIEWIAPRTQRASGVTMREVVRHLDAATAARLMQAYKDGVPAI